jgi:3-phenylpropionate/trans-cinnamate dioxygenase ferredoxin reductase subunit
MERIVVVGGGQAASALMVKLRSLGYDGRIALIGDEPHLPYQRPPLSKKYLAGELPRERLLLRQEGWYEKNRIELHLETKGLSIDRAGHEVRLSSGDSLRYDRLALTTGARPRRLPEAIGGDLPNVFMMRDLADADALSAEMVPGRRALVIGGGYIGLEAAAEAAKKGLQVTLIEMADRLLQRVACRETSDYFRKLHQGHGVTVKEGIGVERLASGDGTALVANLADGSSLAVDMVVIGIGILPNSELAADAGLAIDLGGIVVDDFGRTSDPDIFAAGDCACLTWKGRPIRLESVQNANDQAANVAVNMMGQDVPYRPEPWFWSDQYDVKLQIAGLSTGYDEVVVRSGVKDKVQAHFYYAGDTLLAVDAMNDPVTYNVVKRLLAAGRTLSKPKAADLDVDLKAELASG